MTQPNTTPLTEMIGPKISGALLTNRISTVHDLVNQITLRGHDWWLPVPGLTRGRAAVLEKWAGRMAGTPIEHRAAPDPFLDNEPSKVPTIYIGENNRGELAPLELVRLSPKLSGQYGENRSATRPMIHANDDIQIIRAYLMRCRDEPKTQRSYQKEIERFLLWCVTERGIAMSSVIHDDCEAYKDFLSGLKDPAANEALNTLNDRWVGPRAPRHSKAWRPFAGALSDASRVYAFVTLKTFFKWMVDIRYLSANPWLTVAKPRAAKKNSKGPDIKIEKAFPSALWNKLSEPEGIFDTLCSMTQEAIVARYKLRGQAARFNLPAQFRLARAIILFSGNSGLRREELATALRSDLSRVPDETNLWQLSIIGKGFKERTVYVDSRTIATLQAHWADRSSDFDDGKAEIHLFSPVNLIRSAKTMTKHRTKDGDDTEAGFTADGIYKVVTAFYQRIAGDMSLKLDNEERDFLNASYVHSLRHTFGSRAASKEMPLDVLQKLMGHASLQTTTIYTQSEKKRSIKESKRFFQS